MRLTLTLAVVVAAIAAALITPSGAASDQAGRGIPRPAAVSLRGLGAPAQIRLPPPPLRPRGVHLRPDTPAGSPRTRSRS
jgi:hypothetical protein